MPKEFDERETEVDLRFAFFAQMLDALLEEIGIEGKRAEELVEKCYVNAAEGLIESEEYSINEGDKERLRELVEEAESGELWE